MKRSLSLVLALAMIFSCIPMAVFAEDGTGTSCTIEVDTTHAMPGDEVTVNVKVSNNPGILGGTLTLTYDDDLILTDCANGAAFAELALTKPSKYVSGANFVWYASEVKKVVDGAILTLTFKVAEDAKTPTFNSIGVTFQDVFDKSYNQVSVTTVVGGVQVISYRPGDVTGDKNINPLDLIKFSQYISDGCKTNPDGYNVTINESAADVNDDGKMNPLDLIYISQYISDGCKTDPEGYNVTLKPVTEKCSHEMTKTDAVEPTCTTTGNNEYWTCTLCGKLYEDEAGVKEIKLEDTFVTGSHSAVHTPRKEATYFEEGNIEYWSCSNCNGVFSDAECNVEISIADTVIPMLDRVSHTIEYNLFDNDSYLEKNESSIVNNNPYVFYEDEEIVLNDAEMLGYAFDGWYNGTGGNADRITRISKGTKTNIKLYARWTVQRTYTVYFVSEGAACDVIYGGETVNKIVKPMNEQLILPAPAMKGYIFLCWTDGDGNIVTSIEPGSYGEITLSAHWTSERNQTRPVKELGNPVVIEDETEKKIHFIYELGDIINVPLEVIENFGNVDRLERESETVTVKAMTQATAENVSKTVANLVSNSSSTTLSNEWNENISVSEEQSSDISQEDVDVISDRVENGGQWNISKSNGGTTEYSVATGDSVSSTHKSTTAVILSRNMTLKENKESGFSGEFNIGSSSKSSTEKTHNFNIGLNGNLGFKKPGKVEGSENSGGLGLNLGYSYGRKTYTEDESHQDLTLGTYVNRGTESIKEAGTNLSGSTEDSSECKSYTDLSSSNSASWNTAEGYTESRDDAHEESYTTAISKAIGEKFNYSTNSGSTSGESNTAASVKQNENKDEFSSTVEFVVEEKDETRTSSKVYKDFGGYHRLVEAGTLHVFGIISYDIADRAFYTSTYSILDPKTDLFWDYSKEDNEYSDRENGVLPFEIPFFVNKYVAANVSFTDGLEIEPETGEIHAYNGTAKNVLTPNYFSIDNGDGTEREAVKVTKMLPYIFANNTNIETVMLGDYITEIPEGAFEGCTNLKTVIAPGITSIGKNAFKGCTSLNKFTVSSQITEIGETAFAGANEIVVYASDSNLVKSAINSGAKRVSLYLENMSDDLSNYTIETQSGTEYFALYGAGKTFENVNVISTADETIINRATFNSDSGVGLDIASSKLTLNQVNVNSKTIALLLRKPSTEICLERTCNFDSEIGNTVITNEVTITKTTSYAAYFKVTGNMYVNGNTEFTGKNYVSPDSCVNGITQLEYNAMIGKVYVIFNPNDGSYVDTQELDYGLKAMEPVAPTKDKYKFSGWYTDEALTEAYDFNTPVTSDITLYAKWELKEFTVHFDANGGSVGTSSKSVIYGDPYGELPSASRTYYTFNGWYTAASGGERVTADTVFNAMDDVTLYAQWSYATFTLYFDANGGGVDTTYKTATCYTPYGTLPTPVRDYYTFNGWYTASSGGTRVTADTTNAVEGSTTVYAQWTINPVSGWVLASNVPAGAETISQKWTYDLTTNIESENSYEAGYTCYNSTWAWSDYGSWSGWSTNAVSGSDSRQVETTTVTDRAAYTNYKYIVYRSPDGWACGDYGYTHYSHGTCTIYDEINLTYALPVEPSSSIYAGLYGPYNSSMFSHSGDSYWRYQEISTVPAVTHTEYRYKDRYKIYKYYHTKTESLESSSPVYASSTISNVQHWIQYRAK